MKDLKEVDELQNDEGLAKSAHKNLEEIIKNLKKGESPVMTLSQADGMGGGGYE